MQVRLELAQVSDARQFTSGSDTDVQVKRGVRADLLQALLAQSWSAHTSLGELVCMLFCHSRGLLDACPPEVVQVPSPLGCLLGHMFLQRRVVIVGTYEVDVPAFTGTSALSASASVSDGRLTRRVFVAVWASPAVGLCCHSGSVPELVTM